MGSCYSHIGHAIGIVIVDEKPHKCILVVSSKMPLDEAKKALKIYALYNIPGATEKNTKVSALHIIKN